MEDSRLSSLSRLWYVAEYILLARAATKDGNKGDFIRWRTRARRIAAEVARDAILSEHDGGVPMLKFVTRALEGKRPPSAQKNYKVLIWVAIFRQKFRKEPTQKELKDYAAECGERLGDEPVNDHYQHNPKLPRGIRGKKTS